MMIEKLEKERRLLLINAALEEFSVKGYDKASTNSIAKEAGLSKALMFHYVKNKEALFLYLVDYCTERINKDYTQKMNNNEKDIFERLKQSYLLQIELRKTYPWIFEFNELAAVTKSEPINEKLREKTAQGNGCFEELFESIDETKFCQELSVERCKELIFWSNIGFTEQQLLKIKGTERGTIDYDGIIQEIDQYFTDLKTIFYKA
ncbi:TetR/AcrR family transcriptional regulator [Enterococcus sp. BWR-S5]|uniref:TetR/AcrR family transcriptional regulator n=1 Tax=Enterococcus sp. BWR-S5 TaxID=2787714 RepID=UPI001F485024|nr:TetR/AcrR family transcriptional regulator [Enterococcus sp. BWR-S5]